MDADPTTGWRDDPNVRPDTLARLEKVLELLSVHGFVETACRQGHCSKRTFYEFKERYPDFVEEVEQATARARTELEATGWSCARKALTDPRYNPVLIFTLKAKAGWRESTHVDVTSESRPGTPGTDPRDLSDEDLMAVIEEARQSLRNRAN